MGNQESKAKLVWVTPEAQQQIMSIARVSNPKNQDSTETGLLSYCAKNGHWSIFEMGNICMEINTSRAIARQILRHRSFSFQEFSQRYADVNALATPMIPWEPRSQDHKNRQNSNDDIPDKEKKDLQDLVDQVWEQNLIDYNTLIEAGVAKECARAVLPEGLTPSRMYMNGTIRSWIHFIDLRTGNGTQHEHKEIAEECKRIFCEQLPEVGKALGWV